MENIDNLSQISRNNKVLYLLFIIKSFNIFYYFLIVKAISALIKDQAKCKKEDDMDNGKKKQNEKKKGKVKSKESKENKQVYCHVI